MAKRTQRKRLERKAEISAKAPGRKLDPIGATRIQRTPVRSLDALTRSREMEDSQSAARRERQARLAQIADELTRQGRALLDAAHSKATAPMEKGRANQVRQGDYGSLSRTRANTKTGVVNEHDKNRSPEKVRENAVCKERPSSNRGSGGSREFIPWCKMKK